MEFSGEQSDCLMFFRIALQSWNTLFSFAVEHSKLKGMYGLAPYRMTQEE